jgi:hypothetical protein
MQNFLPDSPYNQQFQDDYFPILPPQELLLQNMQENQEISQ